EYLAHPPNAKVYYTGKEIEAALGRYRRQYREAPESEKHRYLPNVSSPRTMDPSGESMTLYWKAKETVVEYDLPIDGKWSDLTAKFFLTHSTEGYGLALIDLHVL